MSKSRILPLLALFGLLAVAVHFGAIHPSTGVAFGVAGTLFSENARVSDWLKWEEDQHYSRDAITVLSGQNLVSGTVLGKTLVGAAGAAVAFAGNTGNGLMGAITVTGEARVGTYKLVITAVAANAGTFEVEDPNGEIVAKGTVGVAFSHGGLAFTLADGATDFVVGDGFNIAVTGGTYKYAVHDPAAIDGTENAAGILIFDTDATAADTAGVAIVRQAIVGSGALTWKAGMTAQQKTDALNALAALGIQSRTSA